MRPLPGLRFRSNPGDDAELDFNLAIGAVYPGSRQLSGAYDLQPVAILVHRAGLNQGTSLYQRSSWLVVTDCTQSFGNTQKRWWENRNRIRDSPANELTVAAAHPFAFVA